ncbi:MAG: hypothetical protein Q8K02_10080 [Flavobacterium sp.]|nr:hypothetical protein [Flavobacterium sp.]
MDDITKDLLWLVAQYRQALTKAIAREKGIMPEGVIQFDGLAVLRADRYWEKVSYKNLKLQED